MIDERINKVLTDLEANLENLESAREQVEKTVSSYEELSSTTAKYVDELGNITTNVQKLVNSVGEDYDQKVKEFEHDRDSIIKALDAPTKNLSNATEEFKNSLDEIQTKLKYSLIVNVVSLVAIGAIVFFLLK